MWVTIRNCTFQNATAITICFTGDVSILIKCDNWGSGYYSGHTIDNWPLRGAGEVYPFDSYTLLFVVSRQFYFHEEQSLQLLYPNATLERSMLLRNIEVLTPSSEFENSRFMIRVQRDSSVPFLQLLLPVVICFFMLGGSTLIPRLEIGNRLRVYLSLFVFAPTFLIAIQTFLPSRSFLSIPEILLVSILTSNGLFAFSSMIPFNEAKGKVLDFIATILSMSVLAWFCYSLLLIQQGIAIVGIFLIAELGFMSGFIIRILSHPRNVLYKKIAAIPRILSNKKRKDGNFHANSNPESPDQSSGSE